MFVGLDSFDIIIGEQAVDFSRQKAGLKADIWRLAGEGYTSIEIFEKLQHVAVPTEEGLHALRKYVIARVYEFRKAGGLVSRSTREIRYSEKGPLSIPLDADRRGDLDLEASDRKTSAGAMVLALLEDLIDNDRFAEFFDKRFPPAA